MDQNDLTLMELKRQQIRAEIEKLQAETKKINAEADSIELQNEILQSSLTNSATPLKIRDYIN